VTRTTIVLTDHNLMPVWDSVY